MADNVVHITEGLPSLPYVFHLKTKRKLKTFLEEMFIKAVSKPYYIDNILGKDRYLKLNTRNKLLILSNAFFNLSSTVKIYFEDGEGIELDETSFKSITQKVYNEYEKYYEYMKEMKTKIDNLPELKIESVISNKGALSADDYDTTLEEICEFFGEDYGFYKNRKFS